MQYEEVESLCRTTYKETGAFYNSIASVSGNLGFKILYSPPAVKPPILFIGFQPGGGEEDCAREVRAGAHDTWPGACEYATKDWKLAVWLRRMFGGTFLARCVGVNAIFIRAATVDTYKKSVPAHVRNDIAKFCLPRVKSLIDAIEPERIVAIGFDTLGLFTEGVPSLCNAKGRTLTKTGQIDSRRAIAAMHLSGAHIANEDRLAIRDQILNG